MPCIDEKRILGNFGSNLVAHTLTEICLVRPVSEGTDIGVDLYCETIEEGQGFLHFWAQVKCGTQIKIKKNGRASCNFKTDHLRYWNRQPVPVFAFYVNTSFPPQTPEYIFVANISEYLMTHRIPDKKSKVIESHFKIKPANNSWHDELISKVKATSSFIKLREDGIISSIPQLKPDYIFRFKQSLGASAFAEKSLRTIRSTVSSLIFDAALLKYSKGVEPDPKFFEPLIEILKIFEIGERPEIMKALALWAVIMEGDIERANKLIKAGIESINGDPNLHESIRKSWRQEFEPINKVINNIRDINRGRS